MEKKIVVGTDNYEKFIRSNGYYVDKTELIYDLVAGTGNKVTLCSGSEDLSSLHGGFMPVQGINVYKYHSTCYVLNRLRPVWYP